jgi:urease accessory protein
MPTPPENVLSVPGLLELLRLASPSLPIGAYAYSQGLEAVVERGRVCDAGSARRYIVGVLDEVLPRLDLAVYLRAHAAWERGDAAAVRDWSSWLLAARETRELQEEERQLGGALAKVLAALGAQAAEPWCDDSEVSYVVMFALGAYRNAVPAQAGAAAYAYAWSEHQVSAAARLVPLGQVAAQQILNAALMRIPSAVDAAYSVSDDDVGFVTPGLALASARHETQYTRLFRS